MAKPPMLSTDLAPLAATTPAEQCALRWLIGFSNGNTRQAYRRDLASYVSWCSAADVDPLRSNRSHLDLYARQLEQSGLSPSTVARRLCALNGFFGWCLEEGVIESNPAQHVRRPQVAKESPTLGLSLDETAQLLSVAAEDPRDLAVTLLLVLNGLRVSEVCALNIADLSEVRGHRVLTIHGKGGRIDQTPLAPRTFEAVRSLIGEREAGPLLMDNSGARLDRFDANRIVRRLAKRAGLDKRITPHSLRHTAVTLALDAGVSLRDAQDFARHADPRTTRRYDRARASLERHATYRLAQFVSSQ